MNIGKARHIYKRYSIGTEGYKFYPPLRIYSHLYVDHLKKPEYLDSFHRYIAVNYGGSYHLFFREVAEGKDVLLDQVAFKQAYITYCKSMFNDKETALEVFDFVMKEDGLNAKYSKKRFEQWYESAPNLQLGDACASMIHHLARYLLNPSDSMALRELGRHFFDVRMFEHSRDKLDEENSLIGRMSRAAYDGDRNYLRRFLLPVEDQHSGKLLGEYVTTVDAIGSLSIKGATEIIVNDGRYELLIQGINTPIEECNGDDERKFKLFKEWLLSEEPTLLVKQFDLLLANLVLLVTCLPNSFTISKTLSGKRLANMILNDIQCGRTIERIKDFIIFWIQSKTKIDYGVEYNITDEFSLGGNIIYLMRIVPFMVYMSAATPKHIGMELIPNDYLDGSLESAIGEDRINHIVEAINSFNR